jgi:hypothetical protein
MLMMIAFCIYIIQKVKMKSKIVESPAVDKRFNICAEDYELYIKNRPADVASVTNGIEENFIPWISYSDGYHAGHAKQLYYLYNQNFIGTAKVSEQYCLKICRLVSSN